MKDGYINLRGVSVYSSLAVPTLREYIKSGTLSCCKVKGKKILVRVREFDAWMEKRRVNRGIEIEGIVDGIINELRH